MKKSSNNRSGWRKHLYRRWFRGFFNSRSGISLYCCCFFFLDTSYSVLHSFMCWRLWPLASELLTVKCSILCGGRGQPFHTKHGLCNPRLNGNFCQVDLINGQPKVKFNRFMSTVAISKSISPDLWHHKDLLIPPAPSLPWRRRDTGKKYTARWK